MQRKSQHFGALPLWCLLPLAFPLDGQARVVIGPGWTCERGGVGVGGGPIEWGWSCVSTGGGDNGGGGSSDFVHGGGGGGTAKPNPGADEQETNDQTNVSACGQETGGNPVVLYTGNKVEQEQDFTTAGEMPLFLQRTYNHFWNGVGLFGKHWLSNFDYTLAFSSGFTWVQRPDGRRIKFRQAAGSNRWDEDRAQPIAYIVRNADGTYTLYNEERGTEIYSADGYILQRRNEQGVSWSFNYVNKQLQRVTHSSGRSVQFTWSNGLLTQVTDPAGTTYRYTYTANVFAGRGRLASTHLPGTTVTYHYEDSRFPGGLTGKSINGVRYSTFAYDAQARAVSTEHAGGVERHTFQYLVEASEQLPLPPPPPPPGGFIDESERAGCGYKSGFGWQCYREVSVGAPSFYNFASLAISSSIASLASSSSTQSRPTRFRVIETNPLGRRTTHLYQDGRKTSVTGDASPSCPASYRELTYDAYGYQDIVSDNTDRLTDFDHDAHGHLVRKVDAAGTPEARTTQYEWDETTRRLVRQTIVGHNETRYTYTTDGRVASVAVKNLSSIGRTGETLTTNYRYTQHANGLLATQEEDGPLASDTVRMTFESDGNLHAIADGLGHVTTFSNHSALGLPGRVTGPNGDVVDHAYDERGRISATTQYVDGVGRTTRYTYTGAGKVASTQTPDGRTIHFVHDAANRVIEEYERELAGTYARKLITYNVMSQPTSVEVHRTAYPHDTRILGHVEGVSTAGTPEIRGWACTTGQDEPIIFDLYVGGSWPIGTFVGTYRADRPSEAGVAAACSAQGTAYRFNIALGDAMRDAHGGKAIHAHGISPAGKENALLNGSGSYAIPRLIPNVAPAGLAGPALSTTGSFTISWNASTRATIYRLEESINNGAWTLVHNAAATSKALTGKSAADYRYRVVSCNESGCGPYSAVINVREIDPPTTAPVATAPAINTTGAFAVSWNAVAGATTYRLEESNGGAWVELQNLSTTSRALAGKNTGLPHYYRVRACNAAGCGGYSASILVQRIIYDAQIVSHAAPSHMLSDEVATITVTMRNTGNVPWPASGFALGRDGNYAMPERIGSTSVVAPGSTAAFRYTFVAPRGPVSPMPTYYFGGRMVADGIGWFGQAVPAKSTVVENTFGYCDPYEIDCDRPR